jgi:hypothetical protein
MASSDETASFTLKLQDDVSAPADDVAAALQDLRSKIEEDTKALRGMQGAMARLRGAANPSKDAIKNLRAQIAAQKQAIGDAEAKFASLGGSYKAVKKKVEETAEEVPSLTDQFKELLKTSQGLPGPLGGVAARLGPLKGLMAAGAPLAFAAAIGVVAAAAVALVGAVAAATAALLRYGIAQADVRRNELLHLEGLVRIRTWYGLAAGSATELQSAIDRISDSAAIGRGEVSQYAERLYRAGLRGDALSEALEGMSIVAATQGDGMAQRFAGMAAGMARAGGSVRALTDDIRARLGPIAERQAMSLGRQWEQLRERASKIFEGLQIEGLLRALRQATSLFSQNTASGRALKQLVETLFQPLIDQIASSGPTVRRFFQGMILGAQRLTIMFLRARNAIGRAIGGRDVIGAIDTQSAALNAGAMVVNAFAAAVVTAGVVLAGLAAPFAAAFAAGAAFARMMQELQQRVSDLLSAGRTIASSLISGLVKGFDDGRARVITQIRSLASSATTALRDALQIRSPSRVFARLGVQIPRGLAAGVESGAATAENAVADVVSAPTMPSSGGAAAGRGESRVAVSIGDIHVHMGENGSPRDVGRGIYDELVRLLEGAGLELGTGAA